MLIDTPYDKALEHIRLSTFADNVRAQAAFRKVGFIEMRRSRAAGGRVDVHMEQSATAWLERQQKLSEEATSV